MRNEDHWPRLEPRPRKRMERTNYGRFAPSPFRPKSFRPSSDWQFCMFLFSLDALWSKVPRNELLFYEKRRFLCVIGNFHCQKFMWCVNEHQSQYNLTICYRKKMQVFFSCVYPVIDNEFRHDIVKVVCGSIWLSLHGSTATLNLLWRNSSSITAGQTHKKLMSIW